jgi:hypothetical protein
MCVGSLDHLDNCKSFGVFNIFKSMFKNMPIPRHYYYGPRKLNIILTQLRCNASFLNYDLCKVKCLSNASCNCGAPCEISHHFLFDCEKYTDSREILFDSLNWLPSNINIVNKHRMFIYKKLGRDNIRKKRKENKYFWKCVLVL